MSEKILQNSEKNEEILKKEAMKTSIREGNYSSLSSGFGNSYVNPFVVALTQNPIPISFLSSIPGIMSPLAQIYGSKLMEKRDRKSIVTTFVFLQAVFWILLGAIAIININQINYNFLPYLVVLGYTLIAVFGGISGPAWFSWMGDIVPENERGKYFSKRNRIGGTLSLVALLISSLILDISKTKGFLMVGFSLLFLLACSFRLLSYKNFKKQHSPEFKLNKEYYFTFRQFLSRKGNFLKFSIYHAIFYFSMVIAGPFFAAHMLRNLNFGYITYTIVSISTTIFYLTFLPIIGKFSDKYGDKKLLYLSSILFSICPILWIFIKSPILLIIFPQLLAGIATGAFSIGVNNFVYSTVTPQRRGICVAYMNVLIGIGVFFGSTLGGLLIKYVSIGDINPYLIAFGVSGFLRFISSMTILPRFSEIRQVKKFSIKDTFFFAKSVTGEGKELRESIQQSLLMKLNLFKNAKKGTEKKI